MWSRICAYPAAVLRASSGALWTVAHVRGWCSWGEDGRLQAAILLVLLALAPDAGDRYIDTVLRRWRLPPRQAPGYDGRDGAAEIRKPLVV